MSAPASPRMAARLARLETAPLTVNQLGAIHGEFRRLGYRDPWDRAARLAVTAALADSGPIDSTKELTEGQAGRVVGALRACATPAALAALLAPPPRYTWRDVLAALVATLGGAR